jgi:hypothetical protein
MSMTSRRSCLRVWVAIAALGAWCDTVSASALKASVTYSTTGTIGPEGSGPAGASPALPVIFHGVQDGSFTPSTSFPLGSFEVVPQPAGGGTRNVLLPFTIAYRTGTVFGGTPIVNESPVTIHGWIGGSIDDSGTASLRAFFDQGPQPTDPKYYSPNPAPPFRTDGWINTISVNGTKETLALADAAGGPTPIVASIEMVQVPEPGSLVLFTAIALVSACRPRTRRRPL